MDFHKVNNLLNKITTNAGMIRYELETKGIDAQKLDEEVRKIRDVLSEIEGYALEIAEILKKEKRGK